MNFCSDFDATLATHGPAAIFLPDASGELRFDAEWTRDAWGRQEGPHAISATWTLLRDPRNGYVMLALVSSPTLLPTHPYLQVRAFPSLDAATQALSGLGTPPISEASW